MRSSLAPSFALLLACGARTELRAGALDASFSAEVAARDATEAASPPEDVPLVAQLDGLRWELPCIALVQDPVCSSASVRGVSAVLQGPPGARYRVTARFRGVVEQKGFTGGAPSGEHWQVGGTPANDSWNVYSLRVSSPAVTYYLNRGPTGLYAVVPIDYTADFEVDVGARVELQADSVNALEIRNVDATGRPFVVPGIPPAPLPFDGQFAQMDVLSITRLR